MNTSDLIFMMFKSEPIETFEKLLKEENPGLKWEKLLNMCYWEERYESVGGNRGYKENPPINQKRLEYLKKLIDFLESNGIKAEKNFVII